MKWFLNEIASELVRYKVNESGNGKRGLEGINWTTTGLYKTTIDQKTRIDWPFGAKKSKFKSVEVQNND